LVLEEEQEEQKVCAELTLKLKPFVQALLANAGLIGELDLLIQKAALAAEYHAAKPLINKESASFAEMLNPYIAFLLQKKGKKFTPITIELCKGATVITGANMGGKSVALATAALNITLLHYGFYPFASGSASPLFNFLHLLSGNLESQEHGLSSFGGEVIKFNEIAADIEKGFACVFIDEFAHGTNPAEGAAIAQGITEYLNASGAISLLTTHYDKVAEQASAHYRIAGLKQHDLGKIMQEIDLLKNGEKVHHIARYMDYNLLPSGSKEKPPHEALNVCNLLGMPSKVIAGIKKYYKTI
jgi:dsDNA-specific endonuclease/ATPase MutS2